MDLSLVFSVVIVAVVSRCNLDGWDSHAECLSSLRQALVACTLHHALPTLRSLLTPSVQSRHLARLCLGLRGINPAKCRYTEPSLLDLYQSHENSLLRFLGYVAPNPQPPYRQPVGAAQLLGVLFDCPCLLAFLTGCRTDQCFSSRQTR